MCVCVALCMCVCEDVAMGVQLPDHLKEHARGALLVDPEVYAVAILVTQYTINNSQIMIVVLCC